MLSQNSAADEVVVSEARLNLQPYLEYYRDDAGDVSLGQIKLLPDEQWVQSNQERINIGFDDSVYWFRTKLVIKSAQDHILVISYPLLDNVEIFTFYTHRTSSQLAGHALMGDHLPFADRSIKHRQFITPLGGRPGDQIDVFIRVQTSGALQLPLYVWQKEAFVQQDSVTSLVFGLYFGVVLVMVLYNFFIYVSLRDISYLYYIGVVASTGLFQFCFHGFAYQYFWTESPLWHAYSVAIFSILSTLFAMMFARQFLRTKRHHDWVNTLFNWVLILVFIMCLLSPFLPYSVSIRMSLVVGFVVPLVLVVGGVVRSLQGNIAARYFTVAWLVFAIGTVTLVFVKLGYLESNFVTENSSQIGSLIEVILLALALAQRFADERAKRYEAQQQALTNEIKAREAKEKALTIQQQTNEKLEVRVKERTVELEDTMKQLSEANTMLRNLSVKDGLTGINNRRAFDERFELEWKRAVRSRTDLSVVLIDIDWFKKLNDTHGHLTGDEALKEVADMINSATRRPGDFAARFGGEEFVVLLPDTREHGAVHLADHLRKRIGDLVIRHNDLRLQVTVSCGCSSVRPRVGESASSLLECADKALYEAKEKGRNRVEYLPYRQYNDSADTPASDSAN
nr:7TM diverse intracellular signaling domain-containing protein [Pleionea sp. CnH1-48]